jgi:exonuclease III
MEKSPEHDLVKTIAEYFNSTSCYSNKNKGLSLNEIAILSGKIDNYEYLRLFSWNFDWNKRKPDALMEDKINLIKKFQPDIVILQECKYYDCLRLKSEFNNFAWYGDGRDSDLGIGMFSNIWNIKLYPSHSYTNPFRYIVPYLISKNNVRISIFSIWAKDMINRKLSDGKMYKDEFYNLKYAYNIVSAIDYYKDILNEPAILVGDFNSADTEQNRYPEHAKLLSKLEKYKIFNCTRLPDCTYYKDFEFLPTFFMNYNLNKGVVDDYCFISQDEKEILNIPMISVGIPEKWIKYYSDHVPIMFEIMIKK